MGIYDRTRYRRAVQSAQAAIAINEALEQTSQVPPILTSKGIHDLLTIGLMSDAELHPDAEQKGDAK